MDERRKSRRRNSDSSSPSSDVDDKREVAGRRVTDIYGAARQGEGALLRCALRQKIAEYDETMAGASQCCGIGYKYFMSLMSGEKSFAHLKNETYCQIAKFLNTSTVQVMVWAEAISLKDFQTSDGLLSRLEASFTKMRSDPIMGSLLPSFKVWDESSVEIRLSVVLLYERLAEKTLLEKVRVGRVTEDISCDTCSQGNSKCGDKNLLKKSTK